MFSARQNFISKYFSRIFLLVIVFWVCAVVNAQETPLALRQSSSKAIAQRRDLHRNVEQKIASAREFSAKGEDETAYRILLGSYRNLVNAPAFLELKRQSAELLAPIALRHANTLRLRGEFARAKEILDELSKHLGEREFEQFESEIAKARRDLEDFSAANSALNAEHVEQVAELERTLRLANDELDLAKIDAAEESANKVLNIDPYNKAARRTLEKSANQKERYNIQAYNQTRAKLLSDLTSTWQMPVNPEVLTFDNSIGENLPAQRSLRDKLQAIILPSVNLQNAPLGEVLRFLSAKSKELDVYARDGSERGVNIILDLSSAPLEQRGDFFDKNISLKLEQAPLVEALSYATRLAGMKFVVEDRAVVVIPKNAFSENLENRTWRVSPTFFKTRASKSQDTVSDPFAVGLSQKVALKKTSAKDFLQDRGVEFPAGASVNFNDQTGMLLMRNTPRNHDMVDALVSASINTTPTLLQINCKVLDVAEDDVQELGFDWLLGAFNLGASDRVFASGGTFGNQSNLPRDITTDYPFVEPGSSSPFGENPSTAGLRSGEQAIENNSLDALLGDTLNAPRNKAPGVLALAGIFTDPQYQVVLRALSQMKADDVLAQPSAVTTPGDTAKFIAARELIYPTQYDPLQLPSANVPTIRGTRFYVIGEGVTYNPSPIIPATPTTFETRNVGVVLEVTGNVHPDGVTVDLDISPTLTKFEGFINYGESIYIGISGSAFGDAFQNNDILMPVFKTIKTNTSITVGDGQTVLISGLTQDEQYNVEDKTPLFGDLPIFGRLFRSKVTKRERRHLLIFVSTRLIDPSGKPINKSEAMVTN